jgi:alginate O-acetyltransferase complex protein AlgI
MLFNSPEFLLVFLPIALAIFFGTSKKFGGRFAHLFLIFASGVFYAWWDWKYLGLLLTSTCFNYFFSGYVLKEKSKPLLAIGILFNVIILGYFKYTDFAIQNLNNMFGCNVGLMNIVLPLGISFFTFQKIGYLVDCYKGNVSDRDPVRFGLFVMFFPQLIAGPIVHHGQIIPQLKLHESNPLPSEKEIAQGIFYLVVGLFKKVIIADNIAGIIIPGFVNVDSLGLIESWTIAIGYSLQLYFDFSAYSEMALGIALLFGVKLPINFNSPYKATSISDFWRRWHITLGAFMREYIYIPLGGSKRGLVVTMLASMATMLIGGLWHGAGWTFVVWGGIHGCMLVLHKAWTIGGMRLKEWMARSVTLICVIFAWVPFRASSMQESMSIWMKMLGIGNISLPMEYQKFPLINQLNVEYHISTTFNGFEIIGLLALLYFTANAKNVHERWHEFEPRTKNAVCIVLASLVSLFALSKPTSFLYFSF